MDIETLSIGNVFQLCKVRSFYIIDCTNWMNLFNTKITLLVFNVQMKNVLRCYRNRVSHVDLLHFTHLLSLLWVTSVTSKSRHPL